MSGLHQRVWAFIAMVIAWPANAYAEEDPKEREDDVQFEVRLGWQLAVAPDDDHDYWPHGFAARLQIPVTDFGARTRKRPYTEVGFTTGYEFHAGVDDDYRAQQKISADRASSIDALWALDVGLFGRYWTAGTDTFLRVGLEARLGFGLVSGAKFRYLDLAEGVNRNWGIGPAGGATALLALGPIMFGAGLRWQVADGIMGLAVPLVTVGVITPTSSEPEKPKAARAGARPKADSG